MNEFENLVQAELASSQASTQTLVNELASLFDLAERPPEEEATEASEVASPEIQTRRTALDRRWVELDRELEEQTRVSARIQAEGERLRLQERLTESLAAHAPQRRPLQPPVPQPVQPSSVPQFLSVLSRPQFLILLQLMHSQLLSTPWAATEGAAV